jgi:hypothetical protein
VTCHDGRYDNDHDNRTVRSPGCSPDKLRLHGKGNHGTGRVFVQTRFQALLKIEREWFPQWLSEPLQHHRIAESLSDPERLGPFHSVVASQLKYLRWVSTESIA